MQTLQLLFSMCFGYIFTRNLHIIHVGRQWLVLMEHRCNKTHAMPRLSGVKSAASHQEGPIAYLFLKEISMSRSEFIFNRNPFPVHLC